MQFKEINCVFNPDNFDSRQQFSLAQQFAMQSKLLLPRREIQNQRGKKQGWDGLICLDTVFYRAEFQVRRESHIAQGLK